MSEYLKCDVPGCGHIEHVQAITADHVNMSCPDCGANLLTEEDWKAWQPLQAVLCWADSLPKVLTDVPGRNLISVGLHGSTTNIQIKRMTDDSGTDDAA